MSTPKDSIVIDFSADGSVEAMHKDTFPLGFLGKQEITRASEIKFNDETQKWDIWLFTGQVHDADALATHPNAMMFEGYDVARKAEVAWLEGCRLESVLPFSERGIDILTQYRKEHSV